MKFDISGKTSFYHFTYWIDWWKICINLMKMRIINILDNVNQVHTKSKCIYCNKSYSRTVRLMCLKLMSLRHIKILLVQPHFRLYIYDYFNSIDKAVWCKPIMIIKLTEDYIIWVNNHFYRVFHKLIGVNLNFSYFCKLTCCS